ncbi:MAG TPA: serine hydrolase domain-containing protein [Pyrinomonadaceae bacterium]|nr:serine hydrolase domain-containing protein [Pyrinomonadaceae bacterium]
MKYSILLGIILSYTILTFGQTGQIKRLDGSKITAQQIDQIVTTLMEKAKVTGLGLSIINNNQTVYTKTYGYRDKGREQLMDNETILYGASFSKAVFAFLTLKLVKEGVLDLDKPLYQYLDKPLTDDENYESLKGDDRWKSITARMCLSHTTGFQNLRFIDARTGAFNAEGKLGIYFKPGTKYAYSGEGLKLLQLVVEKITGRGLEDLAAEKVFKPIQMTRTSYVWQPRFEGNFAFAHNTKEENIGKKKRTKAGGAGSLETTIADYTKFIEYVMQDKGLNKKLREMMISPQIKINSKYQFPTISDEMTNENDDIHLSYGLGWGLLKCKYGRAFFKEGHDDGWQNYNINFKDKGISIIIMTNSDNGESIFKELLEKVIGDTFTPWEWERYIPYDQKTN